MQRGDYTALSAGSPADGAGSTVPSHAAIAFLPLEDRSPAACPAPSPRRRGLLPQGSLPRHDGVTSSPGLSAAATKERLLGLPEVKTEAEGQVLAWRKRTHGIAAPHRAAALPPRWCLLPGTQDTAPREEMH